MKQRQCLVRWVGLCHAIASAHIQLAIAIHIFKRPVALMCTGLLSSLVKCPGMVCPRDKSRCKADTKKNEDGNVTRNVCVNSVVCLPKFCSVKYQVHHSHVSNKMTIALLTASVDMPGTFKVAVSFASTFQRTSRTYSLQDHVEPFAAGWCQPFSKNNCKRTPRTTRGIWRKKKKRSPARNRSEHHLGFGTYVVSRFWLLHDGSQPWSHVGNPFQNMRAPAQLQICY